MRDGGYEQMKGFLDFADAFPTEEACRSHLFSRRWPDGFACPRCGGREYYRILTRDLYECRRCRYQASLTAGTIMEKTQTPLRAWFWLIFLMSNMKTGVSILGAARLLGISYKRAWLISHKIRAAMAARDSHYRLAGLIELDESYFGSSESGKRGRGASGKRPVLVGVSVGEKGPIYAGMRVLDRVNADEIKAAAGETIAGGSRVATDGLGSYRRGLSGFEHEATVLGSGQAASEKLPWVHVVIANVKGMIRGVHHGVSPKHLQPYLSEFCWRFSRRRFGGELFDRIRVLHYRKTARLGPTGRGLLTNRVGLKKLLARTNPWKSSTSPASIVSLLSAGGLRISSCGFKVPLAHDRRVLYMLTS